MLLIGLTGSIATGKSTVSSLLGAPPYGLPVIDADKLARQVVEPGTPAYKKIVAHFGKKTHDLLQDGPGSGLNRAALGRAIFGDDPEKKADRLVLNSIVHPAVRRAMYQALAAAYIKGYWAVVLDVPLLFESKLDVLCGTVLVVAVRDPEIQMARLRARDPHLSAEDAGNRVRSQGDVRDKARRAEARNAKDKDTLGVVLWNDGDKAELAAQIETAMAQIKAASPAWWHNALLLCPPLGLAVAAWTYWQNGRINARWAAEEQRAKANL
ncbi:Dephospho-CoA kinase cab5 [Sporothrix stenoceras]|uniref:Dephospho-CoA kinase cab5 n=1 Tax=Sporothrix stenoceras TaxID=5173 RepID=A0ABR3Z8I7_9PEZI